MDRTIAVVTVGRSDYGIYRPVLQRLQATPSVSLRVIAAGAHLSPAFGMTVRAIEDDRFPIGARVEMPVGSDAPGDVARAMGQATAGFATAYEQLTPDLVVVLGDRFEMHAAAVATVPFQLPLAHIHGGEVTEGAFDDALRHSITKLSHLHFVSTEDAARRLRQMGEEAWRVIVSGAPSLDQLASTPLLSAEQLAERYDLPLGSRAPLLVTFHPATRELDQTGWQADELLAALESVDRPIIFTQPNPDPNGRLIETKIRAFVASRSHARLVATFGTQAYWSLMATAAAMVGNSSSGILEAPSFELPVVNIGTRQQGRLRPENVIDVGDARQDIARGLERALDPAFRVKLHGIRNPYSTGRASEIIVSRLCGIPLNRRLLWKRFVDAPGSAAITEPVGADGR